MKKITRETDNNFDWLLEKDSHATHSSNNSAMIRVLVHKINELVEEVNKLKNNK